MEHLKSLIHKPFDKDEQFKAIHNLFPNKICCGKNCIQHFTPAFLEMRHHLLDVLHGAHLDPSRVSALDVTIATHMFSGHVIDKGTQLAYRLPGFVGAVCHSAFGAFWAVSQAKIVSIRRYCVDTSNFVPEPHGLLGRASNNSLPDAQRAEVILFIKQFAERVGEPSPLPIKGDKDLQDYVIYLPTYVSKRLLWSVYVQETNHVNPFFIKFGKCGSNYHRALPDKHLRISGKIIVVIFAPTNTRIAFATCVSG